MVSAYKFKNNARIIVICHNCGGVLFINGPGMRWHYRGPMSLIKINERYNGKCPFCNSDIGKPKAVIITRRSSDQELDEALKVLDKIEDDTTVCFRTTRKISEILDHIARAEGVSKSEIVRRAVIEYIIKYEKK